jgi:2-methylisocitrate lyase-like PEP mutase family enzyme
VGGLSDKASRFLELHDPSDPLLLANAWDRGSARLFERAGYRALATTSSGHAATLARRDGGVTREEALAHAAEIVAATSLPVSADLENCFGDGPEGVAETVRLAVEAGLAGCSIEDHPPVGEEPIYSLEEAVERVGAAAEAAHSGSGLVLTARCENYLYGRRELGDTVERLRAYEAAGADVLYAPGVVEADEIREIVGALERPVNVLALPGVPPVRELAELGVSRVSVGGAFAFAALGAAVEAARELIEDGTYSFWANAKLGAGAAREHFDPS